MARDSKAGNKPAFSDKERHEESSKAAQSAIAAQKEAQKLTRAAAGAGDPDERQKLLNQALEKQIAAEKFGKTAKYLQSGTFQGLAAGTGIGTGVGAGLGTLTGTLVGGTTSLATGGLGAAVGSGAGAVHGPFINVAEKAGGAVAKVTGTIPGWEATGEQKKALEQMMGQVEEQEVPTEDDLQAMSSGAAVKGGGAKGKSGKEDQGGSWTQSAASLAPSKDSLPSMPSWGGGGSTPKPDNRPPSGQPGGAAKQKDSSRDDPSIQKERTQKQQTDSKEDSSAKPRPRKLNAPRGDQHPTQQSPTAKSRSDNAKRRASKASGPSSTDTKSSGKQNGATPSQPARSEKKQPRKLEVRSGKS